MYKYDENYHWIEDDEGNIVCQFWGKTEELFKDAEQNGKYIADLLNTNSAEIEVKCDYCRKPARLVTGDVIYPHRTDLYNKKFWYCAACDAWVGCHSNSRLNKPLGRLANAELREWKQRAHAAFDPLWIRKMEKEACSKADAIKAGQKWLAEKLGIAISECHIGMFDVEQCQAVVKICETNKKGSA